MLKSLELFGFKSFADRTLFEFSPGITCVVGPNGSGKSNVVDALKWILGDQSAKSLRGKEMADVIFNGSAGRRASGFAEATLTFDNAAGLLPVDASEVRIGRRLYQSGDSEYLLNQAPVRLKDIRDLFMGTGAGTAAYSIIEQGRVDQILQGSPTARRVVFEEAAGISKFKSRRIEAERRLERVAQMLLRLTDIVDQVDSQLNATRSQASKAARYRELAAELRAAWTGLAADDCRCLSERLNRALDQTTELNDALRQVAHELERLDVAKGELAGQLDQIDDQIQRRDRELAGLRELIADDEATLRHHAARREELLAEVARLRRQRLLLDRQLAFAEGELEDAAAKLSAFADRIQESERELASRERQLAEIELIAGNRQKEIDQRRSLLTETRDRIGQFNERQLQLALQLDALAHSQTQAQLRLERIEEQQRAAADALELRSAERNQAAAAIEARHERLTRSRSAYAELLAQLQQTEQQHREFRERHSAAEARLTLLEELESRQEGIALGVREILKRAASSHYPPWNRVLGLVRDLIDVSMDLAPIVDAALGERAQLIAVHDLQTITEYLNRGAPAIDGRVGFVSIAPLEIPRESGAPARRQTAGVEPIETDFTGRPGVYGRADRLVNERSAAQGLAERVLGDTWIVETLDVARALIDESNRPVRVVTLQGEVLCSSAQLFVGAMPHEASIVSRRSELRLLKNELQQLKRGIEATAQRLEILQSDRDEQQNQLAALDTELQALSRRMTESSTRLAGQQQEVDRLQRERSEQQEALAAISNQQRSMADERQTVQDELESLQARLAEEAAQLDQGQQQMAQAQQLLQETRMSIQGTRLELATHAQRLEELRENQSRLIRDQRQRQRQHADVVLRAEELGQTRRRLDLETLAASARIAQFALRRDRLIGQGRELDRQRADLRARVAAQDRLADEKHAVRRGLTDRQHQLEFAIQNDRHQLQTLADRIQEEYQLSLEDLVASGVSAYRAFLEERFPPADGAGADGSDAAHDAPDFAAVRDELEARVDRLRRKIKALGNVNTDALDSLEELETRHATLSGQLQDLQAARAALEEIIRVTNKKSQRIFLETFETIRTHFQELFRKLFGGGDADIVLENPEDVLECGIEIVARPPGKELRSISLLSGGEKTMTAVAMLFAMFKSKPSPYCILDEVDAALDEANVDRYVAVLKEFVEMTQFVVITHRKRTMTAADVLYGVTMEQAGVSKRMSVRFEDVSDNGEIRAAA